jgi:hypothetical protein
MNPKVVYAEAICQDAIGTKKIYTKEICTSRNHSTMFLKRGRVAEVLHKTGNRGEAAIAEGNGAETVHIPGSHYEVVVLKGADAEVVYMSGNHSKIVNTKGIQAAEVRSDDNHSEVFQGKESLIDGEKADAIQDAVHDVVNNAVHGEVESSSVLTSTVITAKKKRGLLTIGLLLVVLGILLFGYLLTSYYFKNHFLPNTFVNEKDYSYFTPIEAAEDFRSTILNYSLEVQDQDGNVVGVIRPDNIDASVYAENDIRRILDQQSEYTWPIAYLRSHSYEFSNEMEFDQEKLEDYVATWDVCQAKNMEKAKDAYLSEYKPELLGYEIIADTLGNTLDVKKTKEVLINAVEMRKTSVNLADEDCYIRARVKADNVLLQQKCETLNRWTKTKIQYDWNGNEVLLDGSIIHTWILDQSGKISLDEQAIEDFVKDNAKQYDTYGKKRNFITTLGAQLTLPSGAYGWKTDVSAEVDGLKQLIYEGAAADREPVYLSKGAWKGSNDIGNSYVEIDLTHQHLYLYEKGKIILETDFVSGNMSNGCGTPAGVFGLTYKTREAVLRGENYETPVHFWMPFNGNVGMHDATWRAVFGGDIYLTAGSHGCVNLPLAAAESIYSYISTGFPVICYYE